MSVHLLSRRRLAVNPIKPIVGFSMLMSYGKYQHVILLDGIEQLQWELG